MMNKFVIDGLMVEAASGRHVIAVAGQVQHAHQDWREVLAVAEPSGAVKKIVRTHGQEVVHFESGGTLRCRGLSQLRGASADVVFLDWPCDAIPDSVAIARRVIAGREGAEIHRA